MNLREEKMKELAKALGKRIRSYRTNKKISQEKLAELSGCHPTYIGQLERGEKNATLESIEKIAAALSVPLSTLFENLGESREEEKTPRLCYELLLSKSKSEQETIYKILQEIDKYKEINP